MLNFLFKKQRQVESLIYGYLGNLQIVKDHFSRAINLCLENSRCEDFDFLTGQTHKFESKADDIREEIKSLMYGKALIPESRGDIMGLIEEIDRIPGIFQRLLYTINTQKLVIPEFIVPDVRELIRISLVSCDLMVEQVEVLFKRKGGIRILVATIDHNESHCDHIENSIITKIFDSELDPFQKLQLKDLVIGMGEISDQVDTVSKRINIISMKRIV
jgi:predicted phosphate transport protein (TIGR00153 family)